MKALNVCRGVVAKVYERLTRSRRPENHSFPIGESAEVSVRMRKKSAKLAFRIEMKGDTPRTVTITCPKGEFKRNSERERVAHEIACVFAS